MYATHLHHIPPLAGPHLRVNMVVVGLAREQLAWVIYNAVSMHRVSEQSAYGLDDVTELDETRRYWEEKGEDGDRPDDDDLNMVDVAEGKTGRRKKIIGRRRRTNGSGNGGGSPMDTNGVGAAG